MQNFQVLVRIWKHVNSAKHWIAIASKTVTGQYGSCTVLQQVNDQSDQQREFLGVHTALCGVVAGALTVKRYGPKTVGVLKGCKNITVPNANVNSSEAANFQKFQNSNSIFLPLQMQPLAKCRPGRMLPFAPFPPPLEMITKNRWLRKNRHNQKSLKPIRLMGVGVYHGKICVKYVFSIE